MLRNITIADSDVSIDYYGNWEAVEYDASNVHQTGTLHVSNDLTANFTIVTREYSLIV